MSQLPKCVIKYSDMSEEMEKGAQLPQLPQQSRPRHPQYPSLAWLRSEPPRLFLLAPDAVDYAVDGLDKFNTEKEVAQYLRKAFVDKVCRATRDPPRSCDCSSARSHERLVTHATQPLFARGPPSCWPDSPLHPSAVAHGTLVSPSRALWQYHGVWHCIVGRNFGSYVTNEAKHYIYFYQGQIAVLLFKTN